MHISKVILEFAHEIRENPQTLAVVLFGSQARGNARPDSDVDLLVVVPDGTWRDIAKHQGTSFELVYSSVAASKSFAASRPADYLNLWRDAQVLYEHEDILEPLQSLARQLETEGPEKLTDKALHHLQFDAQDGVSAANKIMDFDQATASLLLDKVMLNTLELVFTLKGKWAPAPKQRIGYLREADPRLATFFADYFVAGISDKGSKAQAAIDMVFH